VVLAESVTLTDETLTFPPGVEVDPSSTGTYVRRPVLAPATSRREEKLTLFHHNQRLLIVNAADPDTIYTQVGPFTIESFGSSGSA
jgi:hypothetical protein